MNRSPFHLPPAHARRARAQAGRGWITVLVICVLLAAGGAFFVYRADEMRQEAATKKGARGGPGAQGRPTPVSVARAKTADVSVFLAALGTVNPLHLVTVKSRVDGQLLRVLFREGQMVQAGELLAEIDPRPFEVQLAQAEGQLSRDEALLRNARTDLERYELLYKQDSIALQQVTTQQALVRQYEGVIKVDQAAIDNARLQLSYTRIAAPIAGRIGLRQVDSGNMVRASDANGLAVITQLAPIGVVFTIPEDDLPAVMKKLRAGERLPVQVYDRAGSKRLASGELLTVDNQIDPATGTVKLKAQFANADSGLFPNQFVNVKMLVEVRRGATVVPTAAIQRGTPGTFVYAVNEDRSATVRKVALGPVEGETVAVQGVAPEELVVVDGADRLREGARVLLPGDEPQAAPKGKGKGGKGKGAKDGKGATDGKGAKMPPGD
ncbi:MAG: MdtA/MuxA family multidrug efflux RND transporter periplasmic adaptor subunit [Burkholderiales bacterium]|nr:MdtA/MuxA family multidrug efflux RND transporter periplasmic adaptor subunit [Burkholderiales bacterium]